MAENTDLELFKITMDRFSVEFSEEKVDEYILIRLDLAFVRDNSMGLDLYASFSRKNEKFVSLESVNRVIAPRNQRLFSTQ